jgi:hypothetical protein
MLPTGPLDGGVAQLTRAAMGLRAAGPSIVADAAMYYDAALIFLRRQLRQERHGLKAHSIYCDESNELIQERARFICIRTSSHLSSRFLS